MDTQDIGDDIRATELETLEAIYPEIQYPDRIRDPFVFEIELPVQPASPVTVTFPAAATGNDIVLDLPHLASGQPGASAALNGQHQQQQQQPGQPGSDSLNVSHLPSLRLRMTLRDGYPETHPPSVQVSTDPQWLSQETLCRLEGDVATLWEDMGRDMVAFAYIDHLQRAAEDVFGAITPEGTLEVDPQHKLAVLDHDIKSKKAAFDKGTFDCGVCLDPKKGSKCHKLLDCGHIFCLQCLQDFYNDAVAEGNIGVVRCLAPNCAKERVDAMAKAGKKSKKPKTAISPSELLQIGLTDDTVKRYVTLKYKTELESDKNTIYCPRQWCNGAARSKKHKKPSGLDFAEASGSESESESDKDQPAGDESNGKKKKKKRNNFNRGDLLAVCEDCGFAFCSQCFLSWHGEFVICTPKRDTDELTEEEKASLEYVKLHTSPCPTCNAPAQKTHGCNHMICSRCDSHFCYLCSAWLDPGNPYQHYNESPAGKVTSCYMRLWELEGGDGNDVGLGFVGGQGPAAAGPAAAIRDRHRDADGIAEAEAQAAALADFGDSDTEDDAAPQQPQQANQQQGMNGGDVVVEREGPLVLRLMGNPQGNGPPAVPEPPRAAPAVRGYQRGGGPAAARGRGRGRGGGGGGPARGGQQGGGRGAGRGRRGAHNPQQRQHHHQAQQQQQRNAAGGGGGGVGAAVPDHHEGADNENIGLDAIQEAWVRNFVRMALIDAEDEVEGDSDDGDDDEFFAIR